MDLDLRKLRYFTAVAELEHFGRAAEQLYIAQPVLSRQIRALEAELGCVLLERTTRSVRLTEAGRQLYAEAPSVLAAAETLTQRVHRAARGSERLILGFAPGLSVGPLVRELAAASPGTEVDILQLNWQEQAEAVRDGRVDVGYIRSSSGTEGLRTVVVGCEPKVLCLPAGHRWARRRRLTMADLDGEPMLDVRGRRIATVEEKLQLIEAGEGMVLLPLSIATSYARPGLVHRKVLDAPQVDLCLAVPSGRRRAHVEKFLRLAEKVLPDR